jgi:hypothetical protein
MLHVPWLLPDNRSWFWLCVGLSVLAVSLTFCWVLLAGGVKSFGVSADGVSFNLDSGEVLELVAREKAAHEKVLAMAEREVELLRSIERLEAMLGFIGSSRDGDVREVSEVIVEAKGMVAEASGIMRSIERQAARQGQVRQEQQQQGR